MKLRSVVVALALGALGTAVANCGSEDGSTFTNGGLEDGGGNASSSGGFVDPNANDGGGNITPTGCQKLTCADLKINCGPAGDGCGGLIESCGTCQGLETCGGGGTPSVCGGTAGCVPKTCQQLGVECGPTGDGCGGQLDCGVCQAPGICGGGGPSKCGGGQIDDAGTVVLPDGGACVARTTCNAGECGPAADGCGGLLTCPGCPAGTSCGGGIVPSQCGAPTCNKTTCLAQGATCGFIADGCGGSLNCGGATCPTPGHICGGAGPNKCGVGQTPDAGTCTGFCTNVVTTCGASPTRISGKIYAPNNTLPIPGALIYVPNGSTTTPYGVQPVTSGVVGGTCEQCNAQASGSPLTSTTSGFDGSFTLTNVPAGVPFPIVIQLGKWRRLVTIPATTACTERILPQGTVATSLTRLPTRQDEGNNGVDNIPLVAISTGRVDGLECVFRKLGIEDGQFGNPTGYTGAGGRIRLYRDNSSGNANGGAVYNASTPRTDTALTNTQANLDQYDAVVFGCAGGENDRSSTIDDRVRAYADKGGRVFATHYEYVYLYDRAPWNTTAVWDVEDRSSGNGATAIWTGEVNTSPGKRLLFSQWLDAPGVTALTGTNPPRLDIVEARNDVDRNVFAGGEEWITRYQDDDTPTAVLHYTFNTPVGAAAANQCGRVLFSDFHVSIGNTAGTTFPAECNTSPLTAQEKVLAFFLFDLPACIEPTTPPPPPTCTPLTCAQQGIACGKAGNGCGLEIQCDPCPANQICTGTPAKCVTPPCTPTTCAAKNADCGMIPNGCGSSLDCGPCTTPGQICGGSGPNQCGSNSCTPTTCVAQGIQCGPAANGCGGLLDCGPCPPGQTCGGGGTPGVCGAPACTKRTCAQANANCGFVADGCGGALDCGPCQNGQTCGGGGTPNQCGGGNGPK